MEIGSIGKSAGVAPAWTDAARVALGSRGVQTDVATREAVTPAPDSSAAGTDTRRPDTQSSETLDRRVIIDTATRQIVYQAVDEFTGQVVKQTPDQALLRQRAYFVQVEDAKAAAADAAKAGGGDGSPGVERRV